MGDGPSPVETAQIVGDECLGAAAGLCTMEDGVLHLSGLRLEGVGSGLALSVAQLTVPLVMEDIHVTGFGTALAIGKTCSACDVMVASSTLEALDVAMQIGFLAQMESDLRIWGTHLSISDSSGGIGLNILDTTGVVSLDDVILEGPGQAGLALRGGVSEDLRLQNVSIRGFSSAAFGQWTSLDIRNTVIDCLHGGFNDAHAQYVFIDGLRITGCQLGCECIALALGAWNSGSKVLEARNLTIIGNEDGMNTGKFQTVRISDFTVSENRLQGMMVWGEDVAIRQGIVRANEGNGADIVGHVNVLVEDVLIEDNGLIYDNNRSTNHGLRISGFEGGDYAMRNSSIVGNRVWGFVAGNFDTIVDATGNWWGSALGPSPGTPAMMGNPPVPGFGDMVYGTVITTPHLTSAPESATFCSTGLVAGPVSGRGCRTV